MWVVTLDMVQQDCSLLVAIARWLDDTFDRCSWAYLIRVYSRSITLFCTVICLCYLRN